MHGRLPSGQQVGRPGRLYPVTVEGLFGYREERPQKDTALTSGQDVAFACWHCPDPGGPGTSMDPLAEPDLVLPCVTVTPCSPTPVQTHTCGFLHPMSLQCPWDHPLWLPPTLASLSWTYSYVLGFLGCVQRPNTELQSKGHSWLPPLFQGTGSEPPLPGSPLETFLEYPLPKKVTASPSSCQGPTSRPNPVPDENGQTQVLENRQVM